MKENWKKKKRTLLLSGNSMRWSVSLLVKLFFHVFVDNLVETIRVKHQTSNLKLSFVVCHERENHGPITSERRVKYWPGHFYIIFRFFRVLVFSENTIFFVVAQQKHTYKQPQLFRTTKQVWNSRNCDVFYQYRKYIEHDRVPDVGIYGFNKCFSFQQNNPVYKINWFQRARF